jgi:hypothetical protein
MDGGYILGGTTDSNPERGCIIKTDSNGNKVWERLFPPTTFKNGIFSVVLTPDSGFVFTGGYNAFTDTGYIWVLKLNKSGDTVKDTTYDFSTGNIGVSIGNSRDGGYIIGAYNNGIIGMLIKLDSNFDTVWYKKTKNSQNVQMAAAFQKIIVLPDGSIVGCGFGGGFSDFITKFDSSGNELWLRYFKLSPWGYNDYAYSLDTTSDGGFIMCGRTENNGVAYVPFIKTNCLGFVAPPTASFTDTLGYNGNVNFWNNSQNTDTCYWNWGDGSPIQMVRADSTVPVLHHFNSDTIFHVTLVAIACGEVDSITIPTDYITSNSQFSTLSSQFSIYPNPNDGSFTLSYSQLSVLNSQFLIKDVTGRIVYQQNISGLIGKENINVKDLSNGIYYWEIANNKEIYSKGKIAVIK